MAFMGAMRVRFTKGESSIQHPDGYCACMLGAEKGRHPICTYSGPWMSCFLDERCYRTTLLVYTTVSRLNNYQINV